MEWRHSEQNTPSEATRDGPCSLGALSSRPCWWPAWLPLLVTRNSGSKSPAQVAAGHTDTTRAAPVSLTFQPADGAVNQPLDAKVAVSASVGRLMSVSVTGPAGGTAVAGALDPTNHSWSSAAPLNPTTHYTISAKAEGASGQPVTLSSSFTTLTPTAILVPTIFPSDGLTVGVGMPIELRFNHSVANKAAVLAGLQVTMSTPVPGGWYWFTDKELHFRPRVLLADRGAGHPHRRPGRRRRRQRRLG